MDTNKTNKASGHPVNKRPALTNNIVHNGNGTVRLSNYLKSGKTNDASPEDERSLDGYNTSDYLPLPHQYLMDSDTYSSDSSNASKETNTVHAKSHDTTPVKELLYRKSPGLRKPFRIPLTKEATIITPQIKAFASSITNTNLKSIETDSASSIAKALDHQPNATDDVSLDDEIVNDTNLAGEDKKSTNWKSNKTTVNSIKNYKTNLKSSKFSKPTVYHSPYLNKTFKPNLESLELPPELELLTPLLLSQHEALTSHIKELGSINLNATKTIDKKINSFQLLKNNEKIPRSLRIKCELTTSPTFAADSEFIQLKDELSQEVDNFIKKGTSIMTIWAERNIKLLKLERCNNYFEKALMILEGLAYFFADSISPPIWPSVDDKYLILFMLKAYLANTYFDVTYLTDYLDLPAEDILNIAAKLSLDSDSNEHVNKILSSLKLEEIDLENETERIFLTETLANFDQILHFTSVGIWNSYLENTRQAAAAIKLKSRMKSMEIVKATLATAQALEKATENNNLRDSSSLKNDLRISNLEKSLQKQENKANEIINQMKRNQPVKNSPGSHLKESATSPEKTTPSHKRTKTPRLMVDLTLEDNDEEQHSLSHKKQKLRQRSSLRKPRSQHPRQKTIQWNDTEEVKNYHPNHPVSSTVPPQLGSNPFIKHIHPATPTFFQQVQTPPPPPHYFPQAQTSGNMFHPNYLDIPSPFLPPQQQINSAPIQTLHHNPMQRNTPNPFQPFNQTQNNLAYTNPFGTSQTLHPQYQYQK